jgi:hypothetical protein
MKIIQVAFIIPAVVGIAAGRLGDTPAVALQARTLQGASFGGLQASAGATPIGIGVGSVGSAGATPIGIGVGSVGSAVAPPIGIGVGSVGSAGATPIGIGVGSVGSAGATPIGIGVGSVGSAGATPIGSGVGSVGSAVAPPIGIGANLQAIDLGAIFGGAVTGSIDAEDIFAAAIGIDDEYFFDVVATGGVDSEDLSQGRTVCLFCAENELLDGSTSRVCLICIHGKKNEGAAAGAAPDAAVTPIGIGP